MTERAAAHSTARQAAYAIAEGRRVIELKWHEVYGASVSPTAGAVIVTLPDGYAVHRTCERGVGAIVIRVYLSSEVRHVEPEVAR